MCMQQFAMHEPEGFVESKKKWYGELPDRVKNGKIIGTVFSDNHEFTIVYKVRYPGLKKWVEKCY
jgi:hypothetical protein